MNGMNFTQTERTRPQQVDVPARRDQRYRVLDAALVRRCASWKTPTIPSKVRRLVQGAHEKLRTFEESGAGTVCGGPFHGDFGRLRLSLAHPSFPTWGRDSKQRF